MGEIIFPAPTHPCAGGSGPWPARRRAAWGKLSSPHLRILARVGAGPCPPRVAAGPHPPGPCPPRLGESLEERFPQTPFRPFYAAKTSVLAEFFWGRFPSAEAGGSPLQMGKPWPLAGCWEKAQQSTRGPGDGNGFPWGWQMARRWFAPGLAEGVPRGIHYLPRTYTPLRGWLRALARPQACRVGWVFFLAAVPSCAGGSGSVPARRRVTWGGFFSWQQCHPAWVPAGAAPAPPGGIS